MIRTFIATFGLAAASASVVNAQAYSGQVGYGPSAYGQYSQSACPPGTHGSGAACICDEQATFYSPNASGYYPAGASVPGYGSGGGYNVRLYSPGVRVTGQPVEVASGQVYVEGAPVYVQAPPVRVASPQIYLQRPRVYVQPSQVTVDPPTVHIAGCQDGANCEMVGVSAYNGAPQ